MIKIALSGRAGAGKDHFLQVARNMGLRIERFAYGDAIKELFGRPLYELVEGTERHPYPFEVIQWIDKHKHEPSVRGLLQTGGEAVRTLASPEYWCELCASDYRPFLASDVLDLVAIADVRRPFEAEHARRDGFTIVKIIRTDDFHADGIDLRTRQHESEVAVEQVEPDVTLYNDGTEHFDRFVELILESARDG